MKERLTGAIILVALIVLVVPELLTGPLGNKSAAKSGRPAGAPALTAAVAASNARAPVRSYTLPLTASTTASAGSIPARRSGAPAPNRRAGRGTAPPAAAPNRSSAAPQPPAAISPAPKPASHSSVRHRPQRQPGPANPVSSSGTSARPGPRAAGRWVVQLASFSRHANALRLARRLRGKRLPVLIAPLRLKGKLWWRVWVGPVSDRPAAVRLARRLGPIGRGGEVLRQ